MPSLFSVKVDFDKLHEDTAKIRNNNKHVKFIVMSETTLQKIRESIIPFVPTEEIKMLIRDICGVTVATCNTIQFGDYEIV